MRGVLEAVERVLGDEEFQEAVWRASSNAEMGHARVLARYEYIRTMAEEVLEARRRIHERLDELVEKAVRSMEERGVRVHQASTPEEAQDIVYGIVGGSRVVVFSKSMVAEELGLREYLEERGLEVWETDLGQLLIQLEGGRPMHTTAPAIHLSTRRAARLVREKLDVPLPDDATPEEIVAAVRGFLREKYVQASAGVSGANAIAADTGSIVLVENEGNIRLVTGLPPVHVVVAGVEKIIDTLDLAVKQALVQAAYAGLYPPTYLNIISGPSSTADIEHKRVLGAHGPREVHVVLVDNGRRRAAGGPLAAQLRCIRCGRCQWECPVWRHTANVWGGPVYGGPMGLNWTAITLGEEAVGEAALLCMGCKRCDEVCPVGIPISELIHYLKKRYASSVL